jgi:hypothetical protein
LEQYYCRPVPLFSISRNLPSKIITIDRRWSWLNLTCSRITSHGWCSTKVSNERRLPSIAGYQHFRKRNSNSGLFKTEKRDSTFRRKLISVRETLTYRMLLIAYDENNVAVLLQLHCLSCEVRPNDLTFRRSHETSVAIVKALRQNTIKAWMLSIKQTRDR